MSIPRTARFRATAASLVAALALSGGLLAASAADGGNESAATAVQAHSHSTAAHGEADVSAQTALHRAMRTLWIQHMEWTYATVVAFAEDSPALQPTIDRLLRNQVEIGDAVEPFYGEDAAAQLTALLTAHIELAVPVLTAAKAADQAALDAAVDAWYDNARDIADFLAKANPEWPKRDLRDMMAAHITTTLDYAGAALAGDYASAIVAYDAAEAHMIEMADMLSEGLIAQFPERF